MENPVRRAWLEFQKESNNEVLIPFCTIEELSELCDQVIAAVERQFFELATKKIQAYAEERKK